MPLEQSNRYKLHQPVVETDEFIVGFPLFGVADLTVYVDGVLNELYSVVATFTNGRSDDAVIQLVTAVSGVDVEIYGTRTPRRDDDYIDNSPALAQRLQEDADRLTAVQQEQARDYGSTIRVSPNSPVVTPLGGGADDRAGRVIAFNGTGLGLTVGPTVDEIENAQGYAQAASDSASDAATSAALAATFSPFASRSDAEASEIVAPAIAITVLAQDGTPLVYKRDPAGTALVTVGGVKWSPSGFVYADHFGENTTPGTTDMKPAILSAVLYSVAKQTTCRLLAAEYFISSDITETSVSSGFAFLGQGSGLTKITCGFTVKASALKFFNKERFLIGGFELDGRFDADGSLVNQGVDLAHLKHAQVHDIIARDCEGQGCWVISGSSTITNDDVHISHVRSINCGSSGVQLQGAKNSGISKCSAVNCGLLYATNGGSGSGVYFKVPVEDCYHDNNYAEGTPLGAFNVGSSFPGIKGKRLTFSNGRARNVKRGIRIGEVEDSVFSNFILDLDGSNTDGLGDAIRCETGSFNNSFRNMSVSGVGNSRAAARFVGNAAGNRVEITSFRSPATGAFIAAMEAGCENNQVSVTPTHDATSGDEIQNLGSGNSFSYAGRTRVVRRTIASGAITLESAADHRILLTPESAAATDNLDNIDGGVDGQRITLSTYSDTNDVIVTGSGNIRIGDVTRNLNRAGDVLELVYSDRISFWVEVSFSDNQS